MTAWFLFVVVLGAPVVQHVRDSLSRGVAWLEWYRSYLGFTLDGGTCLSLMQHWCVIPANDFYSELFLEFRSHDIPEVVSLEVLHGCFGVGMVWI